MVPRLRTLFVEASANISKTLAVDEFGKIVIQSPKRENSKRKVKFDDKTLRILKRWELIKKNGTLSLALALLIKTNLSLPIKRMVFTIHK